MKLKTAICVTCLAVVLASLTSCRMISRIVNKRFGSGILSQAAAKTQAAAQTTPAPSGTESGISTDDTGTVNNEPDTQEYAWQFIIDESFDTKLTVPNLDFSYIAKYRVVLDAHKVGGNTVMGNYSGTMTLEMDIDEESFLNALKSLGDVPVNQMNFEVQVQTIDVEFTVIPYDSDTMNTAKNAFLSEGRIPIATLVSIPAMVISSAKTHTTGSIELKGEEGYGSSAFSGGGEIPFVIEVGGDGKATMYLPRMLSMCDRYWVTGKVVSLGLVDLP